MIWEKVNQYKRNHSAMYLGVSGSEDGMSDMRRETCVMLPFKESDCWGKTLFVTLVQLAVGAVIGRGF